MNNYNDNLYDPFQTPKYKRPNNVPKMYPLNQINTNNIHKQQEDIKNQTNVNKQHQQQSKEEEEKEKEGKHNIQIEQFKDKIKTLIIEIEEIKKYQETQKSDKEKQLEQENQYLKSKYQELKEFVNVQDKLIYKIQRENSVIKQKNESQQQQINNLYESNNQSKVFTSDLLIQNVDYQMKIVSLEDQVLNNQTNLKLDQLQRENYKLSARDNERIKQITLLDNKLKEKETEVNTRNQQYNELQVKLVESQYEVKESLAVLKEMEKVILNFKTVVDERDTEVSLLKQSTKELQDELYATENKYRDVLMNKGGATVTSDQTIGIAKKETKLIAQQVLNVFQLFVKIESTLILPNGIAGLGESIFYNENYGHSRTTTARQNSDTISNINDQSPLLNSLRLIREELYNLNNSFSKKCNQLMQFTESGQEFSIDPTNCFIQ